jgi:hypothetical protein
LHHGHFLGQFFIYLSLFLPIKLHEYKYSFQHGMLPVEPWRKQTHIARSFVCGASAYSSGRNSDH